MQPIVVHNEKSNPSSPQHTRHSESSDTQPSKNNKLTREVLLQKQRELQQLHYQQTQTLLNKHQNEKMQLTDYQRTGKLDPNSASQLLLQMEETHDLELKRLQDEHQVEQSELMDLIFDSAAVTTSGGKQQRDAPPQPQPKEKKNTKALWNKAAVSAVAAKTMSSRKIDDYDHVQQGEEKVEEQYEQPDVSETPESYVAPWNRKKESEKKKMEGAEQPGVNETPESYVAPWNRKKKVASTHQSETTPRVTNSNKDMPDKEPPTLPNLESQQPAKAPPIPSDKQRRAEVQAVMRDKTLDKAEKQKRLAEIKAKYASVASQSTSQVKKQPSLTVDTQEQTPAKAAQSRWKRGAASAVAAKGLTNNFQAMKKTEGSTTPIIVFIRKLKENDPSLTTIILDGRKDVSENEWVDLFDAVEENTHLTHLSVSDCGLDDDVTTPLVLALVENETLTQLDLSNNPKLTNSTGKSLLKILKQSNQVLKKVNITGTTISDKTSDKIQECLDDRDDTKKLEKIQAARQQKIKELLAFSASDDVSPSSERLSQRLLEIENEGDDEDREFAKSTNTKSTNSSGENASSATSKKGKKPRKRQVSMEKTNSSKSMNSTGSGNSRSSTPTQHSLKSAVRATTMARQMANMGGEITNVGLNIEQVKQTRKMRGECEDCGQKCFNKTMFKIIPLTITGKVEDGRCLRCTT